MRLFTKTCVRERNEDREVVCTYLDKFYAGYKEMLEDDPDSDDDLAKYWWPGP